MSNFEQQILSFVNKWWIHALLLGSLMMQLLLLVTGGTRKWSSVGRFVAWIAYNWADFVATSALGSLAQAVGTQRAVYAIWAPMLLLHLGGPDNICAYATADSELWLRHGFNMLLQVLIAAYVIANCAIGWKFTLVSICLAIVGTLQYAERTLALKYASKEAIVRASQPIYDYMLGEPAIHLPPKGIGRRSEEPQIPRYYYIIRGEQEWHRNFQKEEHQNTFQSFQSASSRTVEIVTFYDILSSEKLSTTTIPGQTAPIVLVCLAYSLFKMYKRRLSKLYMYEWREGKTRELFLSNRILKNEQEILYVIDMELSFLFDSLYTKAAGTAFSYLGALFRFIATCLLVLSGVYTFRLIDFGDQDRVVSQAKNITTVLLAAALMVELYQLVRLATSKWTMVWLASLYILVGEHRRFYSSFCLKILSILLDIFGKMERESHWRNYKLGQHAMVQESTAMKKAAICGSFMFGCYQIAHYEESSRVVMEFKIYVLQKVLATCRQLGEPQGQLLDVFWFLSKHQNYRAILYASIGAEEGAQFLQTDLENLIVNWHVATCVCELLVPAASPENPVSGEAVDFHMSKLLSRYVTYLLVQKAQLLPMHADIGRRLAANAQKDVGNISWNRDSVLEIISTGTVADNLVDGMKMAKLLVQLSGPERWALIAEMWVDLLLHSAAFNKPQEHLEQLTEEQEFLTSLWVLLGHMGFGSSDTLSAAIPIISSMFAQPL